MSFKKTAGQSHTCELRLLMQVYPIQSHPRKLNKTKDGKCDQNKKNKKNATNKETVTGRNH